MTPSVNVTDTPAKATGADSVMISNVATGADGLAVREASSRRAESATNNLTSRADRPAASQRRRTLSPTVSTDTASPPPLPPPTTISFDAGVVEYGSGSGRASYASTVASSYCVVSMYGKYTANG